jgi:ABC-type multidrug transport system fused ATPase/permease subunit
MHIKPGNFVAIVGPSGAGKTTLIDLLLGVLVPDAGTISISGVTPSEAVKKWRGAISYVPQDIALSNGTIRENVILGYPSISATDELVMAALRIAQLERFVRDSEAGLETFVGERGSRLSGGQRQRLGIARAMLTKPRLLVLDEATSSLDGETEADISLAINALRGSTTILMIAHRLSTVREADLVVYMEEGRIVSLGTFEEVRSAVPKFQIQAKLMGL